MSVIDLEADLLEQCEAIWAATEAQKRDEQRLIREPAVVRVWDGDWHLHHLMQVEYSAEFEFVDNETGLGTTELPFDSPVAQWIYDMWGRMERGEKRNVHITVDKTGARWGGRLADVTVEESESGQILTVAWRSDFEELKFYQLWSNPFLPAGVQIPRIWFLPGPGPWAILTSLFCNLIRQNLPLWSIPDDPLDRDSWGALDQSNWPVVIKPISFLESMAAGHIWSIPISRWKNFDQAVKAILEDGELSLVTRRYLEGDPPPWPGANLKHGTLVVSIEDNSGVYVGTSHGGSLADGLLRTVAEFSEDFIDSTLDVITDTDVPEEYYIPGLRLTKPRIPYAIYRPGITPGVLSAKFTQTPATAIQINTGGHSMPGVNEAISATIQAIGDVVGNQLQIGGLGGAADALLKPIYEDTLLAWMSVKSLQRAQSAGWSRYFEWFQDGADKAYTLSSLMVLRAGMWATRTWFSHELNVMNNEPFIVGDNGLGHLFTGSRVGSTVPGDPTGRIHMDRIKKCVLAWDENHAEDWTLSIGDDKKNVDPMVRVWERLESYGGALHDVGVA